jgi:hypothetical protein
MRRGSLSLLKGVLAAERPLHQLRPLSAHEWARVLADRIALATTSIVSGQRRPLVAKATELSTAAAHLGVPPCGRI